MMNEEIKNWELQTKRRRLLAIHGLKMRKSDAQKNQSQKENASLQKKLSQAMETWTYIGKEKSDIELAWVIYSQIAWKGIDSGLEEKELWEDIPETDPAQIVVLEKLGPEVETLLPDETILLLYNTLNELELHGISIKNKVFSTNWIRNGKKHTGGRFKEIGAQKKFAPKNNTYLPKRGNKEPKNKEKKFKVKKAAKGLKSSLLAAFFGLF